MLRPFESLKQMILHKQLMLADVTSPESKKSPILAKSPWLSQRGTKFLSRHGGTALEKRLLVGMNGKVWTALVLLVPIYWWLVCTVPPFGAVPFTMHMVEKGEHCNSFCEHIDSDTTPFLKNVTFDVLPEMGGAEPPRFAKFSFHPVARDKPPPCVESSRQYLRAPPGLILA